MSQAADVAVGLLQSLGHKSRLMILCQLLEGEKSVGQLADFLQAREFYRIPAPRLVEEGSDRDTKAAGANHLLRNCQRSCSPIAGDAL